MRTIACLALAALFAPWSSADEEKSWHRPYPSPRTSGEGSVPFTANNVQLLSWLVLEDLSPGSVSGNDCWGYTSPSGREYAIVGVSNGTAFVEVTDPGDAKLISTQPGPSSLWHDVKVFGDNAYVVSEGGGGIQVFDMSAIDSGVVTLVNTVLTGGCTTATHNVAIDTTSGFLYRVGGTTCSSGFAVYDLNADPDNPTIVGTRGAFYIHDAQVVVSTRPGPLNGRQLAFCCAPGSIPLRILDVTNKATMPSIANLGYPDNGYSHQIWLTPDQRYAFLNDESDEQSFGFSTRTRIVDVSDPQAPVYVGFFTSGSDAIDHNLYVTDDYIFEANYTSGLRVFEYSDPTAPTEVAFFDTWPNDDVTGFIGLWSNYPFFPSGTVIGSDIEKGLFVWRLGAATLTFDFPSGQPELVDPSGGMLQFSVGELQLGDLLVGSVRLHLSFGGTFQSFDATPLGGDLYEVPLPSLPCGTQLDYYVSATSSDGVTWTDPAAAPTQVYQTVVAPSQAVLHMDDFEVDLGWQVNLALDLSGHSTATTGTWVRANPIGTAAQPEDDHTPAAGTLCFVTANGSAGGAVGEADVDGGATTLRSPALDASIVAEPYLSYWRWYSNNQGRDVDDVFRIDLSNDGGLSWVNVETLGSNDTDSRGGWIRHPVRVADFLPPTDDMRVRFVVSDTGGGSIVEAAIDDLEIVDYACPLQPVTITSLSPDSGDFNGGQQVTITGSGFTSTTTVTFGSNTAPVIDLESWTTLRVLVPAADGPVSGKLGRANRRRDVTVSNGAGSSTLVNGYTYVLPQGSL